MLDKRKALKWFTAFVVVEMIFFAGIVYLFDPFYQYHAPKFGLQQVFFERESQVIGSIRNLPYDSILLGSSVMENCDSSYLDQKYGCKTLKVIEGSGTVADLTYYLFCAHECREIQNVFWGMDLFALEADTEPGIPNQYSPKYLFTPTPLDDFSYLWNKDVLLEKIPLEIAYSYTDTNTKGKGYDWSEGILCFFRPIP